MGWTHCLLKVYQHQIHISASSMHHVNVFLETLFTAVVHKWRNSDKLEIPKKNTFHKTCTHIEMLKIFTKAFAHPKDVCCIHVFLSKLLLATDLTLWSWEHCKHMKSWTPQWKVPSKQWKHWKKIQNCTIDNPCYPSYPHSYPLSYLS